MAADKIRVGIIGANAHYGWSMRAHLPALRAMPDYELTAVCTSRPETAAESAAHYGARLAFHDYHAMVRHPDIDLVSVSVRVPLHHDMVMAALHAGKHVYCEWPLGATLAEAEAMATLARAKGVRTIIGIQAHGDPVVLRLRALLPSPPLLEHYPEDDLLLEIDTDARHRHWLVRQSVRLWTACLTWSSPHLEHYPLWLKLLQ